jgi:hypothetical protein
MTALTMGLGQERANGHKDGETPATGQPNPDDDYPDFVVPLARAVAAGGGARRGHLWQRGWGIGLREQSGGGAGELDSRKLFGAPRRRGRRSEHDLPWRQVVGHALAWELVQGFLAARFSGAERHRRRLAKVAALENTPRRQNAMKISPLAGKPAPLGILVDVPRLITAYYTDVPDPAVPAQRVAFGTSGHRGSSFKLAFNEWHILAITQAICLYRKRQKISGPLFLGIDTHALSVPACATALEVLAANGVEVMLAEGDEYTPTPVISHAILTYNRGGRPGWPTGLSSPPRTIRRMTAASNTIRQWRAGGQRRHRLDRGEGECAARSPAQRGETNSPRAGSARLDDAPARLSHPYIADLGNVLTWRSSAARSSSGR